MERIAKAIPDEADGESQWEDCPPGGHGQPPRSSPGKRARKRRHPAKQPAPVCFPAWTCGQRELGPSFQGSGRSHTHEPGKNPDCASRTCSVSRVCAGQAVHRLSSRVEFSASHARSTVCRGQPRRTVWILISPIAKGLRCSKKAICRPDVEETLP